MTRDRRAVQCKVIHSNSAWWLGRWGGGGGAGWVNQLWFLTTWNYHSNYGNKHMGVGCWVFLPWDQVNTDVQKQENVHFGCNSQCSLQLETNILIMIISISRGRGQKGSNPPPLNPYARHDRVLALTHSHSEFPRKVSSAIFILLKITWK